MRSTILAAVLLGSLTLAVADPATNETAFPTSRGPNSCGTRMVGVPLARSSAAPTAAGGTQRVVWVNRFGGTYTFASSGPGDSSMNIANRTVFNGPTPASAQMPPMSNAFNWPMVLACVKDHYQPFNVRIVESRPRTGQYTQAVVGGDGSQMGFPASSSILGIAGTTNVCAVNDIGIAMCFAEAHKNIPQHDAELCATIDHEVGHLLALEHEILQADLMSYTPVSQTPTKAFVDQQSQCMNNNQIADCVCTRETNMTNSAQRLTTFVGPRQMESVKPTLTIDSPSNNASVSPTFTLTATASDDKAMADVRVIGNTALANNVELGNAEQQSDGKWKVVVDGLLIGEQPIIVIARDEAGNETMQTLTVNVKKAALGEDCSGNNSCETNLCAQLDDDRFCTQTCDAQNACPGGFECTAASPSVCTPTGGGGCCQTTGPSEAVTGLLVLGFGLVISRRRARSRTAART